MKTLSLGDEDVIIFWFSLYVLLTLVAHGVM